MALLEQDRTGTASDQAMVLRVLSGRLAGAEYRLKPGTRLKMGHGLDNDIVLRGRDTHGCLIALTIAQDSVTAQLVAGDAALLGHRVAINDSVLLPSYVPLMVGEYPIAIGMKDSDRWAEADALVQRSLTVPAGNVDVPESPATRAALPDMVLSRWTAITSYLPKWTTTPAFLLLAAFALTLALAVEPLRQMIDAEINGPDEAQTAIKAAGFSDITVGTDPATGNMLISGLVRDEGELTRLRNLVERRFSAAKFDVETTQSLARAAEDMLSGQGIDASAKATGTGNIQITSEYLPIDRQQELRGLLKKDLPLLGGIGFMLTGNRGPEDLKYFFSSEKYGLATFVDGAPGHIVTADGSFWFEGALLPTGHRLIEARGGRVAFERNGQIEEITLAPPMPQAITVTQAQTADIPGAPISTTTSQSLRSTTITEERKLP